MDDHEFGWDVWDDPEYDEEQPTQRRGRIRVARIVAIGVVIAAVAVFTPRWYSALTSASSASGSSVGSPGIVAPGAPPSSDAPRTVPEATAGTVTTSGTVKTAGTVTTVTTVAGSTATSTIPVTTTAGKIAPAPAPGPASTVAPASRAAVTTLQVVPALRGVVVDIDGQRFVSDSMGMIQVPSARRRGTAIVVGIADNPSLRRVGFLQWADGDRSATRSLDMIDGPVAQIGVTLSYRVVVQVPGIGPAVAQFDSEAGPVALEAGSTQWVPASQAFDTDAGLSTQEFTYTVRSYTRAGTVTPAAPRTFLASPEALWTVAG